jgi:nitroimidazol reductase NimA-like FMN-containing flavoprotein (pyridoxamine 5'-phosphate oxidase superfamily)
MLQVEDMSVGEMRALLERVGFGHLGCAREGRPYVVPINYAYDPQYIYIFTTQGTKTDFMEANPQVCLQVEHIDDPLHWQSVMLTGTAERLTAPHEIERAMQLITLTNPTLTPAINATRIDVWGRANDVQIYRIRPEIIDGRKTVSAAVTET